MFTFTESTEYVYFLFCSYSASEVAISREQNSDFPSRPGNKRCFFFSSDWPGPVRICYQLSPGIRHKLYLPSKSI